MDVFISITYGLKFSVCGDYRGAPLSLTLDFNRKLNMEFDLYSNVQGVAKKVHEELKSYINASSTEYSIAKKAEQLLSKFGVYETWYHSVPAFVLLGSRSCLSISGKDYTPSNEKVGDVNLVTVDLSPMKENILGDCARSYTVENGIVVDIPKSKEFLEGLSVEKKLHQDMMSFVKPSTKFSELFEFGNSLIKEYGYENLDFLLNLGHSIEKKLSDRLFIDSECHAELGSVKFFTFEPHIQKFGCKWGFKNENIYYFNEKKSICVL